MTKKLVFYIFFILIYFPLFAQKQVRIMGTVTGEYGQALEFVSVAQINTSNATQTNIEGNYMLHVEEGVPLKITFHYVGYTQKTIDLPSLYNDMIVDMKLFKGTSQLPEVTVEGKTINTIRERLDHIARVNPSNPSIGSGIEGLLVTMGGVSSTNELSTQYTVRGGNFDENMVYVNGIEIYRPLLVRNAQQEGLSFVNPNMVKTVDFSTGGFTAEYGDKMSSVLDVGYKRPTRSFEGLASASFLGGDVYLGSSSKAFSQVTGIRYKTTRSLLKTTDTDAEYKPDFIDAQTYMALNLSKTWEVSFLGNYSHNTYRFTPKTQETKFGTIANIRNFKAYFDGWEKDKFITHQGALSLKGKVSDHVELSFSGSMFGSNEYERYDIGSKYLLREVIVDDNNNAQEDPNSLAGIGAYHEHARNSLESNIYSFSHKGSAKLDSHTLRWGVTYQQEKIKDQINEWELRDSIGYSQSPNYDLLSLYSNLRSKNKIESNRFSGYIQDTYKAFSNSGLWIFNLGARVSHWDLNKETIVSPRGAIAFIPSKNDDLVFRFSTGLYYQAPYYKELQQIITTDGNSEIQLNKNIKSQRSIHFLLGNDIHFKSDGRPFKFTTEAYYKALSNINPYTVNNVKIRYAGENKAKGYILGMDMKLYGEFIPGVDSWVSLSVMKTQQKYDGHSVPLPTDQTYNLSFFFQDYFPGYERLSMSLKGVFAQGLLFSAPNRGFEKGYFRNPAYKRFDLGFAWQVLGDEFAIRNRSAFCGAFRNIWLGMDVFNVFDMKNTSTHYWITDAYNAQYAVPNYLTGRQVSAKLVIEF